MSPPANAPGNSAGTQAAWQGRQGTPQLQLSLPTHAESPAVSGPPQGRCKAEAPGKQPKTQTNTDNKRTAGPTHTQGDLQYNLLKNG